MARTADDADQLMDELEEAATKAVRDGGCSLEDVKACAVRLEERARAGTIPRDG